MTSAGSTPGGIRRVEGQPLLDGGGPEGVEGAAQDETGAQRAEQAGGGVDDVGVDRQAAGDEPGDDPGDGGADHGGHEGLRRAHRVAQAADAACPERRGGHEVVVARHGEHRRPGPLDRVVGAHPAQCRTGGDARRHEVRAGAQRLERGRVQVSSWMSHEAVRPSIDRSANRPAPRPWQTSSGRPSHCSPRRSRPASSRHHSSLKRVATALTASPVREGSTAASEGSRVRRLAPTARVVPGQQPGDRGAAGADEGAGLGDRAEPDRAHLHVAGGPHEVGQQPVDGGDGIGRVALAPLRARPLPRRRERGPGDHPAGAVQRHRLGHGGAEIDADVDGRGHVLRNLGTPGRIGQRPSPAAAAISVPGRRACIVPGRRTASPGPPVHHSSGWRNWQTR